MKRREFIKKTSAAAAFVGLEMSLSSYKSLGVSGLDTKHLTILHTNDVHSYIDPFPANHPKNPNMGGVVRRAAVIEMIRKENPNVLLLDAGDIFQGTPYFNYYGG
jgi:5'-nucleotidase